MAPNNLQGCEISNPASVGVRKIKFYEKNQKKILRYRKNYDPSKVIIPSSQGLHIV